MVLSTSFVSLALALGAFASIGPVADLDIVNLELAPDGFNRR